MSQKRGNRGKEYIRKFAFYIDNPSYKGLKIVQNKLVFVKDINSWVTVIHEYHEN